MSEPYVGEIRMFAGNFAPQGWFFCDGSLQPIAEYDVLFNLVGTTYGGDGENTFGLPDLRGRFPMAPGGGYTLGQLGGHESVQLSLAQLPSHSHPMTGSSSATSSSPAGTTPAVSTLTQYLVPGTVSPADALSSTVVSQVGGSAAHENLPPYVGLSFIISAFGIFPSQT